MKLTEELIHFIWRYKLFSPLSLQTTQGLAVRVLDFGMYNTNAGPDFEYAKIEIDGTLWSGHVEMHLKSSDWLLHQHQCDVKYDSTILHVVWENDSDAVFRTDGSTIPTLVIKDYVEVDLLDKYELLMSNIEGIACAVHVSQVSSLTIQHWLDRMLVERLDDKFQSFTTWLKATNGDWELVFLISLSRCMGMRVNNEAFEELFRRIPLNYIRKYQGDSKKIEALLFGVAGFLENPIESDVYMLSLAQEFQYLAKIHELQPMEVVNWKFLRMRPYNFPTLRIAQLAALLCSESSWFGFIMDTSDMDSIRGKILQSHVSNYWHTHYRFGVSTKAHKISWSKDFINHLFINAIIPCLFAYGQYLKQEQYIDRAIEWMGKIPKENNAVVREYSYIGLSIHCASESQALLHLFKHYCIAKRCLHCAIGLQIMK